MAPDRISRQRATRVACVVGLCLPLLFLLRPILGLGQLSTAIDVSFALSPGDIEELTGASWRTILVAMASAFGAALLGLIASLGVVHSRRGMSRAGQILLILPFFLGEAVIGFVMRSALDTSWGVVQTTELPSFAALAIIVTNQVLRFGGLFAFVMVSRYGQINRNRGEFAVVHGLSRDRFVRDAVIPDSMSTFQVCCCMAFAAAAIENTTAALVFRASPGNHLELLTHWTTRQFNLISHSSPQLARDFATVFGGLEFATTLVLGLAVFSAAPLVARIAVNVLPERRAVSALVPRWHEVAALRLLQAYGGIVFAAILLIGWSRRNELDREMFQALTPFATTFGLGMLAAVMTSAFAGILAVLCSLAWPIHFGGMSRVAVAVLTGALLLSAVPSAYMLLAIYDWALAVLRTQHGAGVWFVGHVATVLPLLFGFFIVAHFSVRASEMEFQWAHGVPIRQVVGQSFVRRFLFTYVLGAFCAFSLVWNDHTINSALSSSVPSFASALEMALEGRSASIDVAALCSLLSLIIGVICALGLSKRGSASA